MDWNTVNEKIKELAHNARYEIGTTEEHAEEILNYVKTLIAKEFKLVASGLVYDSSCEYSGGFHIGKGWGNEANDFDLCEIMDKYDKKNISIYISENED